MKYVLTFLLILFVSVTTMAQNNNAPLKHDPAKETFLVDAACGQCQFNLKGKGCDLAVRLKEKAYFVDGTNIDSHGDAHAADGFCNAVRKAKVQGKIVNNRFHASYFQLVADTTVKEKIAN